MKNLYKSLLIYCIALCFTMNGYTQSTQNTPVCRNKTTSTINASPQSNPIYVAPAAVIYSDNFDTANDTNALKSRGYLPYYRSGGSPGLFPMWFTGVPVSLSGPFNAYNGPDSGYVAAIYECVTGLNDIDNWLVLPALNIATGDSISFYSRSPLNSTFPDSIRVMYSAVGDSVPEDLSWVELGRFVVNVTGVWERKAFEAPSPGSTARFAIRYTVADSGPFGLNGDYIGIDQLDVFSPTTGGSCTDTAEFNGLSVAIPDDDPAGVDDAQTVSGIGGTVLGTDVTLEMICFNISHTWVGDLIVTLTAPNGASVVLTDRPGVPVISGVGCDGDDLDVCVELGLGNEMENVCNNLPAISGTFTAANGTDLNSINLGGGSPNGTWTLNISDNAAQDLGTLNSWSLIFSTGPSANWVASPDTLCETAASVNLDALVTGTAGGTWSGSGVTGNLFDPSGLSGAVTITYTVTDSGCTDAQSHIFFVEPNAPVCSFTSNVVNTTVSFTNNSTGASAYSWDFGDGSPVDNTTNPVHVYATNGTYLVTLSATNSCGTTTCADSVTILGCPDVIVDGSFEAGQGGGTWIELSTNFGTPICSAALCGGTGTGTGPRTGDYWSWFGGIGTAVEEGSVTQTVTLATNSTANLYFWLEQIICDDPSDFMDVIIDGTDTIFHTDGSSALCGQLGYTLQTVNMDAYCDGNTHDIQFHSITFGVNGTPTNIFVDDVSLEVCPFIGIEESSALAEHISILPNPASEAITISFMDLKADKVKIDINNAMGQSMFSKSIMNTSSNHNEKVDVSQWNAGLYIVNISADGKNVISKILIQ